MPPKRSPIRSLSPDPEHTRIALVSDSDNMARPSQADNTSEEPSGTRGSTQTIGRTLSPPPDWVKQTGESSRSHGKDPQDSYIPETHEEEKKLPSGNPGSNPDDNPGNGPGGPGGPGGSRRPRTPTSRIPRRTERQESVPKLKHTLKGAEDFAGWTKHLKLPLFMYDLVFYSDEYTFWNLVDGVFEKWDEAFILDDGLTEKT